MASLRDLAYVAGAATLLVALIALLVTIIAAVIWTAYLGAGVLLDAAVGGGSVSHQLFVTLGIVALFRGAVASVSGDAQIDLSTE